MFGKKMGQLEGAQKGMFFWVSGLPAGSSYFFATHFLAIIPFGLRSVRDSGDPEALLGAGLWRSIVRMPFAGDVPSCPTRLAVTGFD